MVRRPPRVFLDSSVVIAGILSPRGGSAAVIDLARVNIVRLALSETIIREAHENLAKKAGREQLRALFVLAIEFKSSIARSPTDQQLRRYDGLILDVHDRHVLAGAATTRSSVLLSLDRRHFFTETLRAAKLSFTIQTPGDFLTELRASLRE